MFREEKWRAIHGPCWVVSGLLQGQVTALGSYKAGQSTTWSFNTRPWVLNKVVYDESFHFCESPWNNSYVSSEGNGRFRIGIRGKVVAFGELVCLWFSEHCMPWHSSQFYLGRLEAQSNPFIYGPETHRLNLPHESVWQGTHRPRIKTL